MLEHGEQKHIDSTETEVSSVVLGREMFQDTVQLIEKAKNEEDMREALDTFFDHFEDVLHTDLNSDVTSIYNAMEREKLLLRVERLSTIVQSIVNSKPIHLGNATEDHYANAVVANNEAVKIAMAEGEAPGPVKLLMGFNVRSAIGFDSSDVAVHEINTSDFDLRDTQLRSALCRNVQGDLSPEAIKYLIMRVPTHLISKRHMTDKEKLNQPDFIFRGAEILHN